MTSGPFPILADIHQDRIRVARQTFAGLGEVDLADPLARLIDHRQESGGMLHGREDATVLGQGQLRVGRLAKLALGRGSPRY